MMYSEDFYSFFSPYGFLYKENLFENYNEMLRILYSTEDDNRIIKKNDSIYNIFVR